MARPSTTMRVSASLRALWPLTGLLRSAGAAWVTVLTVLFCAMLPAGLPHTAAQGSAFNPATTSVALAAIGPQRRWAAEQRAIPDLGDTQHSSLPRLALALPSAIKLEPGIAAAPSVGAVEASMLHARAQLGARRARAPPGA